MVPRLRTGPVKRRLIRKKNREKYRALKERVCSRCQGTNKDGTRCTYKASCLKGCRRFCKRHAFYATSSKCIDDNSDHDYLLKYDHPYVRDNWITDVGSCSVYAINNILRANAVTSVEMREFEKTSHVYLQSGRRQQKGIGTDVKYEFMYHLGLNVYLITSEEVDDKMSRKETQFRVAMKNMEKFMREIDQTPNLTFLGFFQSIEYNGIGHARVIRFSDLASEFLIYDNTFSHPVPVNLDTFYFKRGHPVTANTLVGIALPNDSLPLRKITNYNPYTHLPKGRKTPLTPASNINALFTTWRDIDGDTVTFAD